TLPLSPTRNSRHLHSFPTRRSSDLDTNMLIDGTKGIQYLHETMELIKEAYIEAMNRGPLAAEKGMGLKVRLVDAKLHEDSVHRRSEEHTSELQSRGHLVCRLLLEKK